MNFCPRGYPLLPIIHFSSHYAFQGVFLNFLICPKIKFIFRGTHELIKIPSCLVLTGFIQNPLEFFLCIRSSSFLHFTAHSAVLILCVIDTWFNNLAAACSSKNENHNVLSILINLRLTLAVFDLLHNIVYRSIKSSIRQKKKKKKINYELPTKNK